MTRQPFFAEIVKDPFLSAGRFSALQVVQCVVKDTALGNVSFAEWMSGTGKDSCPCKGDIVIVQPMGAGQKIIASFTPRDAAGLIGAIEDTARDAKGRVVSRRFSDNAGNILTEIFRWKDAESEDKQDEQRLICQITTSNEGALDISNYQWEGDEQKQTYVFSIGADGVFDFINKDADGAPVNELTMDKSGAMQLAAKTEVTLNAQKVVITGGRLEVAGSVAPTGSGPFCCLANCAFSGAPQIGNAVNNT
jgi:hypothetical protein